MSTISGQAEFNDSNNNGTVNGAAVFTGDSSNTGTVDGNATFTDNSQNNGTVDGNAAFYDNTVNNGEITEIGVFAESAQNNGDVGTLVTEPPSIATQPIGLCANANTVDIAYFSASATGVMVNHRWVVDGAEREENEGRGAAYSGNSAELNLTVIDGGTYKSNVKCRFYNPIGSVDTDTVVLNVATPAILQEPEVVVGSGNATYNQFSNLNVFVQGTSYSDKVYLQFQVDYSGLGNNFVDYGDILELTTTGYPTPGPNPGTTMPNFSGLLDSGVMFTSSGITWRARVKVSDCFGVANTTQSWYVYVNPVSLAPTIITQPVSGSAYAGENVTFTVAADDNFPGADNNVTYQWTSNSTIIEGATSNTLNITIPSGTAEGSLVGGPYACNISSPYYSGTEFITTNSVTATSLGEHPTPPEETQPSE